MTSAVLLGVSVFLGVLALARASAFVLSSGQDQKVLDGMAGLGKADPNDREKYLSKPKETAEAIKKKNLFSPPVAKSHPVSRVTGILGDTALINGKWYAVGEKVGDAKIVEIRPTCVKIEWEGQTKVFVPFDVKTVEKPKREKPVERKAEPQPEPVNEPAKAEAVAVAADEDPLAWLGVKLSPEMREKFLKKWNQMTDEQKEEAKKSWNNMSDEQKKQAMEGQEKDL